MLDLTDDILSASEAIRDAGRLIGLRVSGHTFEVYGLFLDYDSNDRVAAGLNPDGSLIRFTDRKCIIPADIAIDLTELYDTPEQCQLVDDGNVYQIMNIKPLRPGTQTVFYELQVRG